MNTKYNRIIAIVCISLLAGFLAYTKVEGPEKYLGPVVSLALAYVGIKGSGEK